MTTDKGRMHALTRLVRQQEAAGYTLPSQLLDAYATTTKLATLAVEVPAHYDHNQAAGDLLDVLGRGEAPDLPALAVQVRRVADARTDAEHAQRTVTAARERAQYRAIAAAATHADQVVTECLRPVHDALLEQARSDAAVLAGHPRDPATLITAGAKVRAAWARLRDAADRFQLLRQAWSDANIAGAHQPEHDTSGQFAAFADPFALFPDRPKGAAMPQLPWPTEPVEAMLWLVGDAAVAKPWMPTTIEQDEAWTAVYGDAIKQRQVRHLTARAQAGAPV